MEKIQSKRPCFAKINIIGYFIDPIITKSYCAAAAADDDEDGDDVAVFDIIVIIMLMLVLKFVLY